jgi:type IV pilus assembly protein PilE
MSPLAPARRRGFTLIELLVAIAIVGILAAVAYPAYTSFIQRSRRADATALLAAVVQAQERYRSNRSSYASDLADLSMSTSDVAKVTKHYTLALAGVGATNSYVSGYQATATVKSSGAQTRDTECWTMTAKLEGANLSYLAANRAGEDKSPQCWPR